MKLPYDFVCKKDKEIFIAIDIELPNQSSRLREILNVRNK